MRMQGKKIMVCLLAGMFMLVAGSAEANKSSVVIEQPATFNESGKAVIKCTVSHSGNNSMHHTEWLRVTAGDREIARFDFSRKNKPESAIFTREVTVDAAAPVAIEAEASCNIHGSSGPAKMTLMPPGKGK